VLLPAFDHSQSVFSRRAALAAQVKCSVARWRAARTEPLDEWLALFGRRALCACALLFTVSLGLAGWQAASASPLTAWIETTLVPELPLP